MMETIGYFAVALVGAWLSFLITLLIVLRRLRGGLETIVPAVGLGVMAAFIWIAFYSMWIRL